MKKILLTIFLGVLMSLTAEAKIHTEYVDYTVSGKTYSGYLAYVDQSAKKRPGILIIHEWWGLNDYPRKRAEQIAALGYVAFAADLYGKGIVAKTPQEAGQMAGTLRNNLPEMRRIANEALNVLKNSKFVDASKTAVMGYCFGGGASLELARSGADLKGVVSFHGNLNTKDPKDAKNIKAKVLILHGADDKNVPDEQIKAFEKEMNDANVDWQMNFYSHAVH
ncbi:MAG: dienelactone hydrolase family protein, partial [Syntrophothermus sp.]